ncbi:hypothetical protein HPP92_005697 [Vanilla planifolia]|uniref:Uncharacterized protein n=1 Tax=Vanilla planifolia TaxID=51239 RepID=A0A835RNC0_VANPL|nr:hypothetical protein HPP92_005697 [Vanilla planifolia]
MEPNPSLSILQDDAPLSPSPLFDGRRPSRQRGSSSSSSASSRSGSPSSFAASASPSPFHPIPSFAIPFSWEHKPGIPKSPFASAASREGAIRIEIVSGAGPLLLPLPPSFRSAAVLSRKKRSHAGIDPFAAALAECAKDAPHSTSDDLDSLWFRRSVSPGVIDSKTAGIWRWATLAGRLGLYASCKTSCSVSEAAAIVIPGLASEPPAPSASNDKTNEADPKKI